jgi:hypothetical protein
VLAHRVELGLPLPLADDRVFVLARVTEPAAALGPICSARWPAGFGPGVGGQVGTAMWPKKGLEAALLVAAGADLSRLLYVGRSGAGGATMTTLR